MEAIEMKSSLIMVGVVCLALLLPAGSLAAAPVATSKQDTAVAYFDSPDGTSCVIMTLTQGVYRPIGSQTWSYGQAADLQLAGGGCSPTIATGSAALDSNEYRILPLSAAYVVVSGVDVGGHAVDVDVAWVATGSPRYAAEVNDGWSFVGKDVGAHLTGTVTVDGVAFVAHQESAILRSFSVSKNF
jgi:hypothetical protein